MAQIMSVLLNLSVAFSELLKQNVTRDETALAVTGVNSGGDNSRIYKTH